jgi:hypothetical protein
MADSKQFPPLKPLHPDKSLNVVKLAQIDRLSTEVLLATLVPGEKGCLKTRPDGTILDGHHRIWVLRNRGIDVEILPREVIDKEEKVEDVDGTPLG